MGLVRGAVRHYCLGGCSALVLCARRPRPVQGAGAGAGCRVFPVSAFPPRVSCAVCGGPPCPAVPYPRSLVRHSMRSLRSAGSVRLPFWYSLRVPCVCVCTCTLAAPPPPPLGGVARAPRAVPVLGAGRAVQRGPCSSACPASVRCSVWLALGGAARSRFLPPGLGLCTPCGLGLRVWGVPAPGGGFGGWGGAACAPFPPTVRQGGPVGRGVALPWSVPLPCLGRQQSGCLWRHSGHGGRGPHTAPVRACLLSLDAVCRRPRVLARVCLFIAVPARAGGLGRGGDPAAAPLPDAAVLPRGGGGGAISPLPWGGRGPSVPVARGPVGGRWWGRGGGGGGRAVVLHLPPPGRGLWPSAQSPLRRWRIPPRCTHSAGVVGQPLAPGAACRRRVSLAGGGGGG